jgi:hypothetical protein
MAGVVRIRSPMRFSWRRRMFIQLLLVILIMLLILPPFVRTRSGA